MIIIKIIYFLCCVIYAIMYWNDLTWLPTEEFRWSHLVFLMATLLLLENYSMVPNELRCPPFVIYVVYKVFAATVLANAALFIIYHQIEDLIHWLLNTSANLIREHTGLAGVADFLEDKKTADIAEILLNVYFLLWVVASSGLLLPKECEEGPKPAAACRGRRRSRVR